MEIFNILLPDCYQLIEKNGEDSTLTLYSSIKSLIQLTLDREGPFEYEMDGKVFHYGLGPYAIGERDGLNVHLKEEVCIIFSTSKDVAYPIAIFPIKHIQKASDYFVWMVSQGKAKIDWSILNKK
jgi:hypothetical protein